MLIIKSLKKKKKFQKLFNIDYLLEKEQEGLIFLDHFMWYGF